MAIPEGLVFDRTKSDVDRVKELTYKLAYGLATPEEITEWNMGLKGAYNSDDVVRVESMCSILSGALRDMGYLVSIPPFTAWGEGDIPFGFTMQHILDFLTEVYNTIAVETPVEIPKDFQNFSYIGANNIERLLYEFFLTVDRTKEAMYYSGDLYSGEV